MIEIALCLAIIGFALIAILLVLPSGMNTQRDTREETVIGQDASILLEAVRAGALGLDDLKNHVYAIVNTNAFPLSASSPQLMADVDNYPDAGQYCENMTCFDDTYAAVAKVMPIDAGEIGVENNSNPFPIVQQFVNAYDSLGQSYYASQWESWTDLVSNYNGAPVSGWGTWFYNHITGQG